MQARFVASLTMTRVWHPGMTCQGCRPSTQTSLGESNLIDVCFGPRCRLKSDISSSPEVPQADYPLATSDVLVKAALDIGATGLNDGAG